MNDSDCVLLRNKGAKSLWENAIQFQFTFHFENVLQKKTYIDLKSGYILLRVKLGREVLPIYLFFILASLVEQHKLLIVFKKTDIIFIQMNMYSILENHFISKNTKRPMYKTYKMQKLFLQKLYWKNKNPKQQRKTAKINHFFTWSVAYSE